MQLDWLPTGRQTNLWNFKQLATSSTSYLFDEDSWIWYLLKLLENLRSSRAEPFKALWYCSLIYWWDALCSSDSRSPSWNRQIYSGMKSIGMTISASMGMRKLVSAYQKRRSKILCYWLYHHLNKISLFSSLKPVLSLLFFFLIFEFIVVVPPILICSLFRAFLLPSK